MAVALAIPQKKPEVSSLTLLNMARTRGRDENGHFVIRDSVAGTVKPWIRNSRQNCVDRSSKPPNLPPHLSGDPAKAREFWTIDAAMKVCAEDDETGVGRFLGKFPIDFYSPTAPSAEPDPLFETRPQAVSRRPGTVPNVFYAENRAYINYTDTRIQNLFRKEEAGIGTDGRGTLSDWANAPHPRPTSNQVSQAAAIIAKVTEFEIATGCGEATVRQLFGYTLQGRDSATRLKTDTLRKP